MPNSAPTPPLDASDEDFAPWERATAQAEVTAFIATRGRFRWHDRDDLVQECLAHWWQQRHRYDDRRGANRKTFLKRVVGNRLKDLKREEQAEKRRTDRLARSIDELPQSGDAEGITLADFLRDRSPEVDPVALTLQSELRIRIRRTSSRLTLRQQAVVDGLFKEQTITELSRSLDVPKSTLYDELKRIKAEFESANLREFLN